jgi:hydroxyacylglutathione hydrolase
MAKLQLAIVTVTPFQQNCAVLWEAGTRRGAVIDPGGEAPRILDVVRSHEVVVESILLTHGHLDHAGGAEELRRLLAAEGRSVPIIGPDRRDQFLLDGIAAQARAFGLDGLENAAPDRWLAEGEQVAIGGVAFDVLHCPGHTPGHVAFFASTLRLAILGDVLFQGSIGRTDFPYGDHAALLRSIAEKVVPLGDDVRFLCGHGPASTIGAERQGNPFLAELRTGTATASRP